MEFTQKELESLEGRVALLLLLLPACMGIAMIIAVSGAVFSRSPSRRRDGLTALALLTRSKSVVLRVGPHDRV